MVARFHPLVRQANLLQDIAQRELQMSRGGFDPKLRSMINRKSFEGKDYYNLFNTELKVPTWPGVDIKAGFERNVESITSSETQTPNTGLQYLGLGIPLGQGLFTDNRRTALKQAKVGLKLADAERMNEVNKILFSSAKEYWDWYFQFKQLEFAELALRLANDRYQAVKQRVLFGEEAPIDTVEAKIFQQDRAIFSLQAKVDEKNSRLHVSNFLWGDDGTPMELLEGAHPNLADEHLRPVSDLWLDSLKSLAMVNHPELKKISFSLEQLDLERRLAKEMLKPQLNIHYSWLSRVDSSIWASQSIDRNYKIGADFGFPIFLRKERGKLGLLKTKMLQGRLELLQAQRTIQLEIQTNFNELKNIETLIVLQNQMVENYQRLRDGELKKFNNGESSLFLINSREQKLIDSQIKSAYLLARFQKQKASIWYASGKNPLLL